ncbi:sigma-54 dependent transcriptional regulator [Massilibacteroides sp.]|uniref:sigma-54-dependent transcriptional regulator n=1 Tax=Massilibacteroides sp. TaxID=2034766 RepID=UPI0026237FCA|nr:sigma-54 dependent transcriptional regulator [Massilibacteroides sp.]MDD4514271.1 sigma-54 dependent transcriptional regulator [Massilibacteroides sp.]
MSKRGTILVVDDNKAILTAMKMLLESVFKKTIVISSPEQIKAVLRKETPDVVLLDMNFKAGVNNGNEGLFWLSEVKKLKPALPVVLFTAYADIDLAVKGIKEGAADFVVKPWDNDKLVQTLLKAAALEDNRKEKKNKDSAHIAASSGMIWGESKVMLQLKALIEKVAITDANILITGENGTGKEMLAREIHALSKRNRKVMIPVDMGAITESLFESELFGHVKGAFTDANTDRPGKFEAANEGTLFLDEIGNLPYHLQAKLLTVLQSRSVVRVGSNKPVPVDIRLICATNRDLEEMVVANHFREDLLYRINTIHVRIPSLRERPEDIIRLAEVFLSQYCTIYGKQEMQFTNEAKESLKQHPWYGNIRELEHAIEKAVIINDGRELDRVAIDLNKGKGKVEKEITTLEEMEYKMIKESIDKFDGNMSLVAQQLGISRQTLYNKIKRYEL